MRASLIEAIKNVEAEDAPRFNDCVYVDPAVVVDALVEWLRHHDPNPPSKLADLLSEES